MAKKSSKRGSMRERAKQRAEERQQSSGGGMKFIFPEGHDVKFFQPNKGTSTLDIIPYEVTVDNHPEGLEPGDLWYRRTIWVHFGIGAEDKSYLCLKTIGKRCPICDARAQMLKDGDADEELIKSLKPKERELYNVIDLYDEKAGVQLWDMSYYLFGKMLEDEIREGDEDLAGFADLQDGKTIKVRFGEKKIGKNAFLEATRIDFVDRDDYDEDILEDVLDLDAILNILPYEKLEAVFLEVEEADTPTKGKDSKKKKSSDDEEGEEDDTPPSRKKKESGKKKKQDEEEKEEKPSRRSKKKPEPEPEEEEEEEEEEEKPKKDKDSKKKKSSDDEEDCPEGGTFGEDCDTLDECADCDLWEQCKEKQDEMEAEKKAKKKRK